MSSDKGQGREQTASIHLGGKFILMSHTLSKRNVKDKKYYLVKIQ